MDFNRTELRAMVLATGILLVGAAARLGLQPGPPSTEGHESLSVGRSLSETRQRVASSLRDEERASQPIGAGERLDPNTATEVELRRLPGIGPARAAAIVSERRAGGPFRDLRDLTRVPGIGSATVEALAPVLTLRPARPPGPGRPTRRPDARGTRIDVNRAQLKELEQITGIGPVLAARIVQVRQRFGPFRGPEDLLRVPGIGPGILQRIQGEVRF